MSIINQMLKDLENRRNANPAKLDSPAAGLTPPEDDTPKPNKQIRKILLLIISIIVLVGVVYYHFKNPRATKPQTDTPTAVLKKTSVEKIKVIKMVTPTQTKTPRQTTKKVAPKTPTSIHTRNTQPEPQLAASASIQSIHLKQTNRLSRLTLTLSHPIHYQVSSSNNQHLALVLANTSLNRVARPSLTGNNAINALQIIPVDKSLQLELNLKPNTTIQGIDLSHQKPYVLTLTFKNNTPTMTNQTTVQQDKTPATLSIQPLKPKLTSKQIAAQHYQQALDSISADNIDQAVYQLQSIVAKNPSYLIARATMIKLLLKTGNIPRAKQYLTAGLSLTPDSTDLVKLQARIYLLENKPNLALSALQDANPPALSSDPDFFALMAVIEQRLGHYDLSTQLYEQLLASNQSQSFWWLGLAVSLEASNQANAAVTAYKHAISTGNLSPSMQAFASTKVTQLGGS